MAKLYLEGYNSYSGVDVVATAQFATADDAIKKKVYTLSSLQTISVSTHQEKVPVRTIGNINAIDYVMGPRTVGGSLVFTVFDKHFATQMFKDLKKYTSNEILLSDELPPINITLSFGNEYGSNSTMVIYGIRFVDEGQVMSVNDLFTENTFQYVALGIDNLHESSNSGSSKGKAQKTTVSSSNKGKSETDSKTSSSDIGTVNPNNNYSGSDKGQGPGANGNNKGNLKDPPGIYKINQPLVDNGNGTISFNVKDPDKTNIYIVNTDTGDSIALNKKNQGDKDNINIWSVDLKPGSYVYYTTDMNGNDTSNKKSFTIKYPGSGSTKKYGPPTVNNVTDTMAIVSINNPNHDKLILYKLNKRINLEAENFNGYSSEEISSYYNTHFHSASAPKTFTKKEKDGTYKITGLDPNSSYKIASFTNKDSYDVSDYAYFTTFKKDYKIKDSYKKYVSANKTLHVNDIKPKDGTASTSAITDYVNENDIIDYIISSTDYDYSVKQELLLYAERFQNEFNRVLNYNDANTVTRVKPLNNLFDFKDIIDVEVYQIQNNKKYYIESDNIDKGQVINNGKPNKHFLIQSIKKDYTTENYDFVCYEESQREKLQNYNKVNVLENCKNTKYSHYNYSNEFKEAMIAYDNYAPFAYLLDPPSVTYIDKDEMIVNVDYSEMLNDPEETYYLCIKKASEILDYSPYRKLEFNCNDKVLYLDKYETGIIADQYYFLWIENSEFLKISDAYILNTCTSQQELQKYYNKLIYNFIDNYNNIITETLSSYKNMLGEIKSYVSSMNIDTKDIHFRLIQEILDYNLDILSYEKLDELIFESVKPFYIKTFSNYSKVLIKNNILSFEDSYGSHIATIDFYGDSTPVKKSYDSSLNLETLDSNYTLIFLVSNNLYNKSGFVLRNNKTGKIYDFNVSVEVK